MVTHIDNDDDEDMPGLTDIDKPRGSACHEGHRHEGGCCSSEPDWEQYYWSLWLMALPFMYIHYKGRQTYAKIWVPFLFELGEYIFGGRENAGKVAHQTRMVRGAMVSIRLLSTYLMLDAMDKGPKAFLKGGADLPLWFDTDVPLEAGIYAWLAMVSMSINMLAVLLGSAANHHKIQQYYDKQIMLQELDNRIHPEHVDTVPHGWKAPRPIFWVNGGRYLHDLNGLTGSVLSSIIFVSVMAAVMGGSLGIGQFTLGKLFFVSSMLATLSVMCVPLTTHGRLWAHKKVIVEEMNRQGELATQDIKSVLEEVFKDIHSSNECALLRYHCTRACQLVPHDKLDASKIVQAISPYLEKNHVMGEYIKNKAGNKRLPLMDALNLIETQIVARLMCNTESKAKLPVPAYAETLLFSKLNSRGITNIQPLKEAGLIRADSSIDKEKVTQAFPANSNPHGRFEFVPDLHTEMMVECAAGTRRIMASTGKNK